MIKKIIFLFLVFMFLPVCIFAYSVDDLSLIEKNHFGQSFENESFSERLNRLETNFFGMEQSGSINSRLNNLFKVSKYSFDNLNAIPDYSLYQDVQPKKSLVKRFFDKLSYPFEQGTYTGYVPPYDYSNSFSSSDYINDNFLENTNKYCPYQNRFNDSRFGNYNSRRVFFKRHHKNLRFNNPDNKHYYSAHDIFRNRKNFRTSYNNPHSYNSLYPRNGNVSFRTGSRVRIIND